MTTSEAEKALQALQQEAEALPALLTAAVNGMRTGEVKRLKQRQEELEDLVVAAKLDLLDARLAALPNHEEMKRRGQQAKAELEAAEAEHQAAIDRLIAARTMANVEMTSAIGIGQQRDRLLRAKQELQLRYAAASAGQRLRCDGMGNILPSLATEPETVEAPKNSEYRPAQAILGDPKYQVKDGKR